MEIADIFIVNKADRDNADAFVKNLRLLAHSKHQGDWEIPVIKSVATQQSGIHEIIQAIEKHHAIISHQQKHILLLAEKAWQLDTAQAYERYLQTNLQQEIQELTRQKAFNLYRYISNLKLSIHALPHPDHGYGIPGGR